MRREATTYGAALRAFRAVTAELTDGEGARARMLASAACGVARRGAVRRTLLLAPAVLLLVAFASGAAAWTALGRRRVPVPHAIEPEGTDRSLQAGQLQEAHRPVRVIPAEVPVAESPAVGSDGDGELAAYARAHRAHFVDDQPARALAAWDAYLSSYPSGTLVPEATYNRALCLMRLGRLVAASAAIRPFVRGRFGAYRRDEAARLLDWLAARAAVSGGH